MNKLFRWFLALLLTMIFSGCGGSSDPAPKKSGLESTKEFTKSLRTQLMGIVKIDENGSNGFLDNEALHMEQSLESVMLDIQLVGKYAGAIISKVVDADDEGLDTAVVEDVETGRDVAVMRRTELIWDYNITENGVAIGNGTLTLPDANLSDSNLSQADELNTSLVGTFPLYHVEESSNGAGVQNGTLVLQLISKPYGSSLNIKTLSVSSSNTLAKVSDMIVDLYSEDKRNIDFYEFKSLHLEAVVSDYIYNGELSVVQYVVNSTVQANAGRVPSKIVYTGLIKNSTNNAEIDGTMQLEWLDAKTKDFSSNTNEKPHIRATVSGILKRPSYAPTTVTFGFENPLNATSNIVTFSYKYDTTQVDATGTFDQEMENGTIVITTSNGIKMVIKVTNGDVVYGDDSYIEKDGEKLGRLEERNGVPVIVYKDGTFESLQ